MPTGMNVPVTQDWGAVNVGRGAGYKKPTSARGIDAAKKAGKLATEKRWVRFRIIHGTVEIYTLTYFSFNLDTEPAEMHRRTAARSCLPKSLRRPPMLEKLRRLINL